MTREETTRLSLDTMNEGVDGTALELDATQYDLRESERVMRELCDTLDNGLIGGHVKPGHWSLIWAKFHAARKICGS